MLVHNRRVSSMLSVVVLLCAALATSRAVASDATIADEAEPRLSIEWSRTKANGFLKDLRLRLQAGMAESPMAAIAVCAGDAPKIAERWSSEGVIVRRTALKVRQSENAPTAADRATLMAFAKRLAAGESAGQVETFSVEPSGQTRYARALITEAPCLVCHGENIAPAIAKTIGERYPEDAATGFRLGDLRGIVVVESRHD
ncbi:MAG: Tll0287-like domain-containing protein [Steroidobacteraceae bacterium]